MSEACYSSLPYPPQDCPCRDCRVSCVCGRQTYGHGGGGIEPGGFPGKAAPDIEALAGAFIENLSVAIAVKLKAMEVFPQDGGSNWPGRKCPVEVMHEER